MQPRLVVTISLQFPRDHVFTHTRAVAQLGLSGESMYWDPGNFVSEYSANSFCPFLAA